MVFLLYTAQELLQNFMVVLVNRLVIRQIIEKWKEINQSAILLESGRLMTVVLFNNKFAGKIFANIFSC